MKLLPTLALLAVFLLATEAAGISWSWGSSSSETAKVEPSKTLEESKKSAELNQMPKDEEGNSGDEASDKEGDEDYKEDAKPLEPGQQNLRPQGGASVEEQKTKIQIVDDGLGGEIPTIHHLDEQQQHNQPRTPPQQAGQNQSISYSPYGQPQQSDFVDQSVPYPTQSQGADPRFAGPRQCQEGQYLCRKVHPQQEQLRCIPNEWRCNGVRDCEENDDEDGCNLSTHRPTPYTCHSEKQYTCYGTGINGIPAVCIDKNRVCDRVYDCTYGDDESQCAQYATRRQEETVVPSNNGQPQPEEQRPPVQQAPPQYPYPQNQPQQPSQESQQPPPQQQPRYPEPQQSCSGKSEEYVRKLEWVDRCIRSCMKNHV